MGDIPPTAARLRLVLIQAVADTVNEGRQGDPGSDDDRAPREWRWRSPRKYRTAGTRQMANWRGIDMELIALHANFLSLGGA